MSVTTGPSTDLQTAESGRTPPHQLGGDSAGTSDGTSARVRRRTLAKGAMWAVPAVALAVPAPAYAASTDAYAPTVCRLYYPDSSTVNHQVLHVFLGVSSTSTIVPKGTEFKWTVAMTGNANNEVPSSNYSKDGRWSLSLSPDTNTVTSMFTVSLKVLADGVTQSELNCNPSLVWTNLYTIGPGSRVNIQGQATTSGSSQGKGGSSSLVFDVAKRYPTGINDGAGRRPHRYVSKSGAQSCYPQITYKMTTVSRDSLTCGNDQNDTSTIYPDGTCVKISGGAPTSKDDRTLPAKC